MRSLADESVERQIVDALRRAGYDVDFIAELAPGAADPDVLERANRGSSVLITGDGVSASWCTAADGRTPVWCSCACPD